MPFGEAIVVVVRLLGGLAFFIYGMKLVSEALQAIAGSRMRDLLYRLTRNRVAGLTVGSALGFSIHSGATTVLLVTFIHAGMLTLASSIPVMLGANVGTTLSMQLISFKVGKYALLAVAMGILLKLAASRAHLQHLGAVLLGFGLIFLGMDTMSDAVVPLKEAGLLANALALADARTVLGFAIALLMSTAITAIFQSSGATIGVLFALCAAGVFRDLTQVFPMILGAHIGTCSATLIGAVGTNMEARRSALSHLAFNVVGTGLAVAMMPLYLRAVPWLAGDLTRQVANTHTLVQSVNALIFLPFSELLARLVTRLTPSNEKTPERSHLEDGALDTPERAIALAMREARRMAVLTRQMLVHAMAGLLRQTNKPFAAVLKTETVVDTLKRSINAYLLGIAQRQLSTRQSIMLQHLMVTAADLERIGDHIETIVRTTEEKVSLRVWFDEESMRLLVEQYERVDRLLRLTILSLDPDLRAFKQVSREMLNLRREFVQANRALRRRYRQRMVEAGETACNSLYYERYLRSFERIVRHTKSIARLEQEDIFKVKPAKFEKRTERVQGAEVSRDDVLPIDERLLREELSFDDLGIDPALLSPPAWKS